MNRIANKKRLCLITALALGALNFAPLLYAGPIPLPQPGVPPTAGQSLLIDQDYAPNTINVDWEVIPTTGTAFPQGLYAYLYQIENTSTGEPPNPVPDNLDSFEVTLSQASIGSVVAAGVLTGDDLDNLTAYHPAHDAANFPILTTETEPGTFHATGFVANISVVNNNVTWNNINNPSLHIGAGTQSDTFYFLSTLPPTYGDASSINSDAFVTNVPGAQPVPVPVPEPSTALLLVLGACGLIAVRRAKS